MYKFLLIACFVVVSGITVVAQKANEVNSGRVLGSISIEYPVTKKKPTFTTYHNEKFSDEYGWMKDVKLPEVTQWAKLQDNFTSSYTRSLPQYKQIRDKISSLSKITSSVSLPEYSKDHVFYAGDALDGKWYLYRKSIDGGTPEVMPIPFDARAAPFFLPNSQGTHVAMALAMPGGYFDWRVFDIEKKTVSKEFLIGTAMGNTRLAWMPDGKSFYYISSDKAKEPKKPRNNLSIKQHVMGSAASSDILIYKAASEGSKLQINLSTDGQNLIVVERDRASTAAKVFYFDTGNKKQMYLNEKADASYVFLGNDGSKFFFETDKDAPRGKIVSIDMSMKTAQWKDVISLGDETVLGYQSAGGSILPIMVKDRIIVVYQKDLKLKMKFFDFSGRLKKTAEMSSAGLYFNANGLNALSGKQFRNEALLRFIGITEPNTILKVDAMKGEISVFRRAKVSFNADDYKSEIVFAESKDGAKIPISLTYKKGLKRDGKNYLMMQVYGAIAFVNYPYFQGDYIGWLEMGGIHAVAHIRGGGAYGAKWHKDGIARNKQNGIDDYIAAINWAVKKGYTSHKRTILNGVSAGTIPVAGVLTQKPDLVGGAVFHYGMLDMLSYASTYGKHKGHGYMVPEIGNPATKEDFEAIKAYSPYQKIDKNKSYPPTLALTSDMDAPMNSESYRWVARMQNLKNTTSPQLLQMAWGSGHSGFGSRKHSPVTTFSDELAFLVKAMDIKLGADLKMLK